MLFIYLAVLRRQKPKIYLVCMGMIFILNDHKTRLKIDKTTPLP